MKHQDPRSKIQRSSNLQISIVGSRTRRSSHWSLLLGVWCFFGSWILDLGVSAAAAPRSPWTSNRVIGSPHPPAPYGVERLYPAVTFKNPVDLAFIPGTTRLCVAEQQARLWTFDSADTNAQPELAFDLRQHHRPVDNILGFTFHPGFATNRFIFINYNEPGGRENGSFVSRFTFSSLNPPNIDPASERIIIRWFSGGHNGCTLAFGNDGFLYISTGDAADPDPPDGKRKTGQDISDLLASILRIDVDRADGTNNYTVPHDNPFVQTPGARPEVWAFGFRNPFRMSFDHETGDLWVGDVGFELWEMVYRVVGGGNYGWPINEGPNLNVRTDLKPGPGPIRPPVHSVPHSDGASITGGFVYRGKRLPMLRGSYIYGDWETGKFWALRHDVGRLVSNDELCDTALKPVAFALDSHGELIILDYNGGLYEFVPNAATRANESFPRKLSETGLFTSLNPLTPAPGTVPYQIASPMWNDHAKADWLLAVPGTETIRTEGGVRNIAGATWFFPSNTVLARTLTLEMESGKPASKRRIETQLLHWDGQAWNPHSYRWRPDGTDADLVGIAGTNDTFAVTDALAPGGVRETPWRFMGRAECLRCHNAWAGEALTLNWFQLAPRSSRHEEAHFNFGTRNSEFGIDQDHLSSAPNELQRLENAGVLRASNVPRNLQPLANPYDDAQPLADRARSWLHVNCATCHRNGAGGAVAIHLNYDKPAAEMRAIDQKPTRGDFGIPGARIIESGAPYRSSLFYRLFTEGAGHMPQIGSRLVDETGARVVRDWIRSLPRTNPLSGSTNSLNTGKSSEDLLATTPGALALLDSTTAVSPGMAGNPTELASYSRARDTIASVAAAHTNAMIRDLFQRLLPPTQRRQTLGADIDPQTVLALNGSAARGKAIFTGVSQCANCHVCGGEGRAFGPDLSGLGRKYNRAQLLDHILNPSKLVAPEFKTTMLTLADDSEVSGFVLRRDESEIVLRDDTLRERRFSNTQVRESRESTLSAMPEGLLAPLTPQEAADLVEFLFASPAVGGAQGRKR